MKFEIWGSAHRKLAARLISVQFISIALDIF